MISKKKMKTNYNKHKKKKLLMPQNRKQLLCLSLKSLLLRCFCRD